MHDIDRTQLEMEWETDSFGEYEAEYDEYEGEYESEYEPEYENEGEYEEEYESYVSMNGEVDADFEGIFDEAEEMELAADLLEVTDEAELEQFIGKLFKKVKSKVGRALKSTVGRSLVKGLRGIARKALPIAGRAAGTFFGGPIGGAIGGKLASGAGKFFGLELEGLSPEDQEFEVARRYVRLVGEAAKKASLAPSTMPPQVVAQRAVAAAVKKHAPGLMPGKASGRRRLPGKSGRWVRKGKTIVLHNV